ncbi:MAG: cytochrome P450 [Alphaproteobacteria bacterium]|nr:cytochrome P450 [Alphaproteobacteria bacterium]
MNAQPGLHEGLLRLPAPVAGGVSSAIDPYSDDVLRDPYPAYAQLRALGRVVWMERYGVYALTHYEDVKAILTAHDTFGSSAGAGLSNFHTEKPWRTPSLLLETDPPEHDRTRRQMVRVLNPASIRILREDFEREADKVIGGFAARGGGDAFAELCLAFPLKVFADSVGLREDGRENLLPYGDMVFNGFGPCNERFRKSVEPMGAVLEWIASAIKRENLKPGGFGARLYEGVDAGEITEEEAGLLVRSFLSAGLDTTVFTLSNALVNLARHPDQWALLRNNPALAKNTLEEVLRYDGTFHSFYRTARRDCEIAGVPISINQKILVLTACANRDETYWPDADKFDITRKTAGHMGFGHGIHACVGQMLARLEGEIALETLARHAQSIELTSEPQLHFNNTVRGYKHIPLAIQALYKA